MTSVAASGPAAGPAEDESLSAALRRGTRDEHRGAESAAFITDLLEGRLSAAAYADLAAQQHVVYSVLEDAGWAVRATGWGGDLVLGELSRVPAIEADLARLWGPGWRRQVRPVPAAQRYAARLAEIGSTRVGYPAHAYVRYLGDLSGGQVVSRMVARHYGVVPEALNFYRFPDIPRLKPFKDLYRARLDALPLTAPERAAVVAEARAALDLNRAVFEDLGRRHRPGG